MNDVTRKTGTCHCGKVRFDVVIAPDATVSRCNCSICRRTGAASVIVKPGAFRLLAGEASLGEYAWGGRTATRYFCTTCGVHAFGRGHLAQLGGDYVSVNVNCIDAFEIDESRVVYWDGRHDNWQAGPRPSPWPVGGEARA